MKGHERHQRAPRDVDIDDDNAYWEGKVGTVYLLCFDRPVGTARGPVQHYLGWAYNLEERIRRHRRGLSNSAALCRSAQRQGIDFRVVRTGPGLTRDDERAMKRSHKRYTLCPEPACVERTRATYKREWQQKKARRRAPGP